MEKYIIDARKAVTEKAKDVQDDLKRLANYLCIEEYWIYEIFRKEFEKAIKNGQK